MPSECSSNESPGASTVSFSSYTIPVIRPERHAPRAQLDRAVGGLDVGQVVAGVGEPEAPGRRLEDAVQAGDEHLRRHVRAQVLVDPLEHRARVDQPLRGGPQHAAGRRHHQRGRDALVGDVADDEADPAVRRAGSRRRSRRRPRGPAGSRRRPASPARSGSSLGRKFCWISRATSSSCSKRCRVAASACCCADQLADPQGRRRLGGQVVEQLAVVGGVLLLRAARTEVEHADQLALADQRHGQLDAGRLHGAAAPGVQLERLDVDRTGRALQVGQQRVVRARCRPVRPRRRAAPACSCRVRRRRGRAVRPRKRRRKDPVSASW